MITFSKSIHFRDKKLKESSERYLKFGPHWSRYWVYPFVKHNVYFKDKDVLDVGGGHCSFADYLEEPWKSFDVLDKDFNGCRTKKHTNFVNKDITKEIPSKKYDIIICLSVLEHIRDWKIALKNMDSCLKIGGELVLVIDIFSLQRQFVISQIPEILTVLSNYDLGKIDLSMNDLWSLRSVLKNVPTKFPYCVKNQPLKVDYDLVELYISGKKLREMEVKEIEFPHKNNLIVF